MNDASNPWPPLPFAEWQDTATTLHMWTQIVGKIRLTLSPWINHSWHVTLYLTSRGLTTSPIPHGTSTFEIRFDFIDHELRILKSDGAARVLKLRPQSVAKFYREVMNALDEMGLPVTINMTPNEIQTPIPFDEDEEHRSYDREYANRFWRKAIGCSRSSGRGFVVNAVRCISFGAASIWRSRGFPGGPRHRIPAGSRICLMQLRERRIRRR